EARRLIVAGGSSLSTFVFPGNLARPIEETHIRPVTYRDNDGKTRNTWIGRSQTDDETAIAPVEATGDIVVPHVSCLLQKCRTEDNPTRRTTNSLNILCDYLQWRICLDISDQVTLGRALLLEASNQTMVHHAPAHCDEATMLAVGHSGPEPLSLYTLGESSLPVSMNGIVILCGNDCSTAVYGLTSPPLTSPIGNARDTLLSGW
ncbi:MAG: hypothetical protein CYPHOPRED_001006, partial [Cyphobasidiales sp. Tagirdzhanova-0007]